MAVKSLARTSSILKSGDIDSMLVGYESNHFHHLETVRLGGSASSIEFTNLSRYSDYQHLQIRLAANGTTASTNWFIRLNGDTGANYVGHYLVGTGSQVLSGKTTNTTNMVLGVITSSQFGAAVADILDAYETTKNKTIRSLAGNSSANRIDLMSGMWMNTSALTTILISPDGGSWVSGSRFSLYGIKARS